MKDQRPAKTAWEFNKARIIAAFRKNAPNEAPTLMLFGSVARDEDGPGSDIDVVVLTAPGFSLQMLFHIKNALEEAMTGNVPLHVNFLSIENERLIWEDGGMLVCQLG